MRSNRVATVAVLLMFVIACNQAPKVESSAYLPNRIDNIYKGRSLEDNLLLANKADTLARRITNLEHLALFYYLHHNDATQAENQDNLYRVLHILDAINPQDPSYLMGLGYLAASQGKMDESLQYYEMAATIQPNEQALLNLALYAQFAGDRIRYEHALWQMGLRAVRNRLLMMQQMIVERQAILLNTEVSHLPASDNIFILLGFELNADGTMKPTLINRLEVALSALEHYPSASIIVTGGVERGGNTEAKMMAQWLIEHGISKERIVEENMARDTVENILFSLKIIEQQFHIKHITLISSSTHLKRAVTLLKVANDLTQDRLRDRESFCIHNLGWQDVSDEALAQHDEFYAITRDVLRIAGMWAYPKISR